MSVNDRVLLHLSRFVSDLPPEEFPPETAQAGIASAVGISRTHVPRAVKMLIKEGLVSEITARVKGHERRMNVYVLTAEGIARVEELWRAARDTAFQVIVEGRSVPMKGTDIEARVGKKRALAAISQSKDGVLDIDGRRAAPVKDLDEAPKLERFFGRDAELKAMDAFMESEARMLVLLGNKGYGTTSLARKFASEQEELDVLWVSLSEGVSADGIKRRLLTFAKKANDSAKSMAEALNLRNALLIFDDYFSVGEDVVELFQEMADAKGEAKILVTAREETPAYNWFYKKSHVESGTVQEMRLKGLDEINALRILGNDKIEKDALRRIMMITRGQPMTLKMLREGDAEGLRRNTVFTAEEIRYLLFLKDKTS
jgi:DNA-binding MarR family transcriptional regulator